MAKQQQECPELNKNDKEETGYPTPSSHTTINSVTKRTKKTEPERMVPYNKKKGPKKSSQLESHKEFKNLLETCIEINNNNPQDIIHKSDPIDFDDFELYSGSSSPEISEMIPPSGFFPSFDLIEPRKGSTSSNDNLNQGEYIDQLFDNITSSQSGYFKDNALSVEISDILNSYSTKHFNGTHFCYPSN